MYSIHIYVFLCTQEFQVIDMALIFNDLSTYIVVLFRVHFNLIKGKNQK